MKFNRSLVYVVLIALSACTAVDRHALSPQQQGLSASQGLAGSITRNQALSGDYADTTPSKDWIVGDFRSDQIESIDCSTIDLTGSWFVGDHKFTIKRFGDKLQGVQKSIGSDALSPFRVQFDPETCLYSQQELTKGSPIQNFKLIYRTQVQAEELRLVPCVDEMCIYLKRDEMTTWSRASAPEGVNNVKNSFPIR